MEFIPLQDVALSAAPSYATVTPSYPWPDISPCPDSSLLSQLQTTLDVQQQLNMFSMAAGKILPLASVKLQTALSEHQAMGSKPASYQHKSLLMLEQQCLAQLQYHSDYPFSPMLQRELLLLETEWLFALRNALVVARLQQMALKDPLTNLGNRRFFDDSFDKAVQLAKRRQHACVLILLDLDNFKQVNDHYGHAIGDEVLIAVADAMRDTLRATDSLFRFGGDEFAVVLSAEDSDSADLIARRLLKAINQHHLCQRYGVTASLGLGHLQPEQFAHQLFLDTDKALYAAKQSGKNNARQNG